MSDKNRKLSGIKRNVEDVLGRKMKYWKKKIILATSNASLY
jgi:hypothetical protein